MRLLTIALVLALGACSQAEMGAFFDVEKIQSNLGMKTETANPASENCVKSGGTLEVRKNGAGDTYGVCLFEDNHQCEEWSLLQGHCPSGGLRVTGYITDASRYCALRGGKYIITAYATATERERGTCTLPNDKTCDVYDLWNGTCGGS